MITPILFVPLYVVGTQTASYSSPSTTPSLVSQDRRLDKTIRLSETAVTVNQILQKVSDECGVSVRLRDSKFNGEQRLCIFASDIKARELLEAIAGLFHYRNITSHWDKSFSTDGYVLRTGGDYLKRALQVKEAAKTNFLKDVAHAKVLLNKPKSNLDRFSDDSWVAATLRFHDEHGGTEFRDGLTAFFNGLTLEQQSAVLSGQPVTIENPIGNKSFENLLSHDLRDPTQWSDAKLTFMAGTGQLAPILWIRGPKWMRNIVGTGADELKVRKSIVQDWVTRHDNANNAAEKNVTHLSPDDDKPIPQQESHEAALTRVLLSISKAHNIPVVVLLPDENKQRSVAYVYGEPLPTEVSPNGKTLESLLTGLSYSPYRLDHKWTAGVLVMRDSAVPFLEALRAAQPVPVPKPSPVRTQ